MRRLRLPAIPGLTVLPALLVITAALAALATTVLPAQENYGPCGKPPSQKPRRIKGGEAFPPLPLPATPLRRTERKRDPAPPTLIGKVRWGETHSKFLPDGRRVRFSDWNLDPSDMEGLLRSAARQLKVRYRHQVVDLRTFSFDSSQVPILYITGARPFGLDEPTRQKLRDYLLQGGTLWGETCWGWTAFADSFRAEMKRLFPDRPLLPLPPDHPLFNCMFPLKQVEYSKWVEDQPEGRPYLEGIYLGDRVAVVFTPYDLSCAWDSMHVCNDKKSRAVVGRFSHELGLNMITYAIAYRPYARYYDQARRVVTEDNPGAEFVFAQVKHAGHWDPDPAAFSTLMRELMTATNVKTGFRKENVSLLDPDLSRYPFLYLTGQGAFHLSNDERAALRRFLRGGGFLLADASCGDLAFDAAFRREMAATLNGITLTSLPEESAIYSVHHVIDRVRYTPRARVLYGEKPGFPLEGIAFDGSLRVVYSRFDLGNGLEGITHPFAVGVVAEDARKLAVNVVVYAMTH